MGGNQGDVKRSFDRCIDLLEKNAGHVYTRSRMYSTKAWGPVPQPHFLNMAIGLHSMMPPEMLLRKMLDIEKTLGRKRDLKYGPRTIDIDMLFYGHQYIDRKDLKVPHPELQNRRFALIPCCDIAPAFIHPLFHKSLATLLDECTDQLEVKLWKP